MLIYTYLQYNLFYQHDPQSVAPAYLAWGHAISTDLLHWTNLPVALKEYTNPDGSNTSRAAAAARLVDKSVVEVFAQDGATTLTDLVFPRRHEGRITLSADDGSARLVGLRLSDYKPVELVEPVAP